MPHPSTVDGSGEPRGRPAEGGLAAGEVDLAGRQSTGSAAAPSTRVLRRVADLEPLVLLLLAPVVWFAVPTGGLVLLAVPALMGIRRLACGALRVRTAFDVPLLALLVLLPLTVLPVADWSFAAPKIAGLLLGIALVGALANVLSTERRVRRAAYALVIIWGGGVTLVALFGIEQPAAKLLPLEPVYDLFPTLVHGVVHGTREGSVGPNEVAGALTLMLPLGAALALDTLVGGQRPGRGRLVVPLAVVVAMAFGLLLTQSRSAFIGTALGLAIVAVWWADRAFVGPRRRMVMGGLVVVALGALAAITVLLLRTWADATGPTLDTLPQRQELWGLSVEMLRDAPLTGIGPGQFPLVLRDLYPPTFGMTEPLVPHAHNFVLQVGLDLGIPGAVAFVALLAVCAGTLVRSFRATQATAVRAVALGIGSGLLAFGVYGIADAIAVGARGGIGLWIVLGLAAALARVTAVPYDTHKPE